MKKKISVNKWSFDNMPESYDSHLKRSIPLYQESQFFISKISSYFIKDENINYEIGLGFDFYLFYFKFSPSIRGIFSMQNELIPDNVIPKSDSPWTGGITKMVSRGFAINFTFE